MIAAIWLTTLSREYISGRVQFYPANLNLNTVLAIYFLYVFVSLFVICISCASISIKVRCSRHLYRGAASSRERKLTTTSLIIALVSLLSWLPYPVFYFIVNLLRDPWNPLYYFEMTVATLYLANSLVNPIIYSLQMPEFKACVVRMFCKAPNRDNAADLPLNNRL